MIKEIAYKTQLQIFREKQGMTASDVAQAVIITSKIKCEDVGHMERVISYIESFGKVVCPKPRKTYELKAIANWMTEISGRKYNTEDIIEWKKKLATELQLER